MNVTGGSTDVTTYVVMSLLADGSDATGLTIADLDLQYVRSGDTPVAKVDAVALAATNTAHTDNRAIEIDATDQPGVYRVDWPDAAFAAGVKEVILSVKHTTCKTAHLRVSIDAPVNVTSIAADQQSATDLKDFADAGYDPSTNKVQGVVLVDTLTTYTGNTVQTGDSFAIVNSGTHGNAALKTLIDTIDNIIDTEFPALVIVADAIKAKTDSLTFTVAGDVDCNVQTLGGSTTPVTNMGTVFNTDFASNYNTSADRWNVCTTHWRATEITTAYTGVGLGVMPYVMVGGISGDETAADTLELFAEALDQSTGQIDNGTFAAGAIDAAAIAASAIDAATFAADVDAEARGWIGMASANLDTQLADIPTVAEFEARTLVAASYATASALAAVAADNPNTITKNVALAAFMFFMRDSADHVTGKTGLTITATRSLDGAAFAACANSATEIGNGVYKIDLAAGDLNGNVVCLKFSATGADSTVLTVVTQPT